MACWQLSRMPSWMVQAVLLFTARSFEDGDASGKVEPCGCGSSSGWDVMAVMFLEEDS